MAASGSGTTVARLRIEFLGDLAKYRESLKSAKTEGDAAAKTIGQSLKQALAGSATGQDVLGLRSLIGKAPLREVLGGIARDAGRDLQAAVGGGLRAGGQAGASAVKAALGGLKGAADSVFKGLLMGAGIAAFTNLENVAEKLIGVIPELVKRGEEYAEVVRTIAVTSGASAEASSRLAAALVFVGAPTSGIATTIGQLSRRIEDNLPLLERMGVTVRDGSGAYLDAVAVIDNLRSSLSRMGDGIAKNQAVLDVFGGRAGLGKMVEYLRLTDAQMAILGRHFEETGQVLSEGQLRIAEEAQRAGNDLTGVLNGLASQLLSVVGPAVTQFFGSVAATVAANADLIKQRVGEVVAFVSGMVGALLGMTGQVTSVAAQVGDAFEHPMTGTQLQIARVTSELAGLSDGSDAAAAASNRAASASAAQTRALAAESAALAALARAQDRVYQRRLDSVRAILDERRASLDAAEAARDLARQQHDLNEQLNEAQAALSAAQAGSGGRLDAEAVAAAMKRVADVQRQQSDLAHRQEVDAQRRGISDTAAYIDEVVKLVQDGEDRKAAAKELAARRAGLTKDVAAAQAGGDAGALANARARLEAVNAAIEQNAARQRTDARQAELDRRREQLSSETAAVASAAQSQTAVRRRQLEDELARLRRQDEEETKANEAQRERLRLLGIDIDGVKKHLRGPSGGGGKGGDTGLQGAFADAQAAGVEMGDRIRDALSGAADAAGRLADGVLGVAGALGKLFGPLVDAWNSMPKELRDAVGPVLPGAIVGFAKGGPVGAAVGGAVTGGAAVVGGGMGNRAQLEALHANAQRLAQSGTADQIRAAIRAIEAAMPSLALASGIPGSGVTQSDIGDLVADEVLLKDALRASGHAAGGPVGLRGPELGLLGERGPEFVLSDRVLAALGRLNAAPERVLATVAAGGGAGGPLTVHTHLHIDGREVAETVDRWQADRRRF